jgi:hypothetical protein
MCSDSRRRESGYELTMAMIDKVTSPNSSAEAHPPIEYLTENGFSIIRLCDIDESISAAGTTHHFLVRDPNGYELQITVNVSDGAIEEIFRRSRGRISTNSSFWISFDERQLGMYLWENDDYPPDAKLTVDQLTLDDIDLAIRWDRDI